MKTATATLIGATLLLNACASDLLVTRVDPEAAFRSGYPYQLRFTQFEVPVTWRVIGCKVEGSETDGLQAKVSVRITAPPKAMNPLDPDHLYAIDPRSLQGLFRTSAFSMDWYEDRGTKSINSTVDDQTGTAIVSALTAAARIATIGIGAPAGEGTTVVCPADLVAKLATADAAEAETKTIQQDVDRQAADVIRLTALITAAAGAASASVATELADKNRTLAARTIELDASKERLKTALGPLTETQTHRWPLNGRTLPRNSETALRPSPKRFTDWGIDEASLANDVWFALRPIDGYTTPAFLNPEVPQDPAPAGTQGSSAPERSEATPTFGSTVAGLPYREPRPMRLFVCKGGPCADTLDALALSPTVVSATDVQIFQAGTLFVLPFQARRFASTSNAAGFTQTGVLTSASSSVPRAAGTTLAETAALASAQIVAGVQADRAAETLRAKARTDEINALTALATAEAGAQTAELTRAYQAEATLASAERAALEARAALAIARAAAPAT